MARLHGGKCFIFKHKQTIKSGKKLMMSLIIPISVNNEVAAES